MQADAPWYESAPAIVAGILAVASAVLGWALHWWRRIRPEWLAYRSSRRAGKFFADQELLRIKLRTWRRKCSAMRAMLIVARNCGWTDPAKPVLVSIVTESEDDDSPTVYEQFQDWPADGAYKRLLHDVHEAGTDPILIVTPEMPQGRLRDHYQSQGTVASVVFMLGFDAAGAMLYLSFNFGTPALGRFHRSGLWGDPEQEPTKQWAEAAEIEITAARRMAADLEQCRAIRREGSRTWFGR